MTANELHMMADHIAQWFYNHRAPVMVYTVTETARAVRFGLAPGQHTRIKTLTALVDDLGLSIGARRACIVNTDTGLFLEIPHPSPGTVRLPTLLRKLSDVPEITAVLGVRTDGAPLLVRLPSPDVAHILISGTTGSGKSVLLRTIAASLMHYNDPADLGIVAIDPKGRTFPKRFTSAHLLTGGVITENAPALDALRRLVTLMEIRDDQDIDTPHVVIVVDELADLLMTDASGVEDTLVRIVQRGRQAGLHLIAATQHPSAKIVSGVMRANLPIRIVGRVISASDALIAAGRGGTKAETLGGRGEFIAVTGEGDLRFQAAYLDVKEMTGTPGSPAFSLPDPAPVVEPEAQLDDLDILTRRLAPWWRKNAQRWHEGEWGIQQKAIAALFPGDSKARNAGVWRETLLSVVERLENSTTTEILPTSPTEIYQTG